MLFSFVAPNAIHFGVGTSRALLSHARTLGTRALVVSGNSKERSAWALEALDEGSLPFTTVRVSGEPTVSSLLDALEATREFAADFVIAIGGGSAIDLGKALAALSGLDRDPYDFLEVIGRGEKLPRSALPLIAVPTTSGPGSEVTKNAVLTSETHRAKVSLRHDSMVPKIAILDPALTLGVPRDVSAATGLDAITQCLEPLVSRAANPFVTSIAEEGLRRGFFAIDRALEDGSNLSARTDLAYCSLVGGLALANAKLGAVHGFAAPLGGMFRAPHGAVCARLLPLVVETNVRALREREPNHPALEAFRRVAVILTSNPAAQAEDAASPLTALVERARIPGLASYGVSQAAHGELVTMAKRASSMAGNPITLSDSELVAILERAS